MQDGSVFSTITWSPARLYDYLESLQAEEHDPVELIIYEMYVLYPWLLEEQGFSEVLTVQTIGVIRYLAGKAKVKTVAQPASIKKPTRNQMRVRGIEVPGETIHARDASLHALYHHHGPRGLSLVQGGVRGASTRPRRSRATGGRGGGNGAKR